MPMATTAPNPGSVGSPVARLRSLADTDVTVTTQAGQVTGSVLSCTRTSVWLICGDDDVVIAMSDIVDVAEAGHRSAA